MTVKLRQVEIEGLRGVNSAIKIGFSEGMNLLIGDNGTGKTSVLQAIEWCITGKVPSFSGTEFTREDAIVNLFHEAGQARVAVQLDTGNGRMLTIERKRTRKNKTTGKNPLTASISGKTYKEDDAVEVVSKAFAMKPEDFSKYCYLHQEDVRRILSEDPQERSESIDSLLGTIQLRELVQAIDIKKKIISRIGELDDEKNRINKVEIETINNKRKKVNELKASLIGKGFLENDLDQEVVHDSLLEIIRGLQEEAKRFAAITKISREDMKRNALQDNLNALERAITEVDRSRMAAMSKNLKLKSDLMTLRSQHKYYEGQLQQLKGLDLEKSTDKLRIHEKEICDIEASKKELAAGRENLDVLKGRFSRSEQSVNEAKRKLGELGGDKTSDLENQIISLTTNIKEVEGSLQKFSELARLQDLSTAYLEANPTDLCPVCNQRIDLSSLLGNLKKIGRSDTAKQIKELEFRRAELKKAVEQVEQKLESIKELVDLVSQETATLNGLGTQIEKLCGKKLASTKDIEKIINLMEGEETSKAKTLADKREEASKLDSVLRALQSCLQQIDDIERRVRSAIGTKSKGTELLEEVDKTIVGLKEEIATYEDTEALDGFRTKTTSLREIADYFKEKQELEELEKQARDSSRLVQDIEKRTLQLQNLQGSAEAIRSVIMEELKTETLAAIGQLGQLLNQYYSAVTGHTYFTDLVFETDPKKPLLYNVRAASADKTHSTYLGTRFSTAQMNLAAIALFLSMNQSAMTEVRTIIMDDPSQSMDLHHKNALAKLLCEMSNSRQIVLATQDAELGGEIRTHPPKNINIYEFRVWSTNGPSISHESKE